jgi:hypothetical protein
VKGGVLAEAVPGHHAAKQKDEDVSPGNQMNLRTNESEYSMNNFM